MKHDKSDDAHMDAGAGLPGDVYGMPTSGYLAEVKREPKPLDDNQLWGSESKVLPGEWDVADFAGESYPQKEAKCSSLRKLTDRGSSSKGPQRCP